MNILILGARGLLGDYLIKNFKQDNTIYSPSKEDINITNGEKIEKFINENNIDIVINAAGLTNIYICEKNPQKAYKINASAPGKIAEICYHYNVKFIHYSSNFVFDGKSDIPYTEKSKPNPLNIYGKSKFEGEEIIIKENENALIIRSAEIFGTGEFSVNHNIPYYIVRQIINGKRLTLYDINTSPTYAYDLVKKTEELINKDVKGIVHIVNNGMITYSEVADKIGKLLNSKINVFNKSKIFDFEIPHNIQMISGRLKELYIDEMPDFEDALKRFINEVL